MTRPFTRRELLFGAAGMTAAAVCPPLFAAPARKLQIHIGYTGITWKNDQIEQAVDSVSSLGFYGFETFGDVLSKWKARGGLAPVLKAKNLPLISGYCTVNLTDPSRKEEQLAKAKEWCGLIKECGGRIFVVGPNPVKRDTYDFAASKSGIVSMLNELAQTVEQEGLTPVLHQHTGTCIESRDETYAVLEAVDTRHLKFGPDVGQLTKGGQDAVKVVKDFLPIVQHMHLKDFDGNDDHLLGYCPLGRGKVDVPAILKLMDGRKISGMVMVELDNDFKNPSSTPSADLAKQSRDFLKSIGVGFRG
ncbi:MAG: sugar phosphate isomerase/epimerase [Acidobacteriaceae bacterium]|jgi:inosose dehydratase|nr:sugar phosphate isomerase/epimerase [Acidobacteriaceae bacterium]